MHEHGVHALLERAVADEPPPSRVDVKLALSRGRRRLRRRMIYVPGASALAAATVFALLVTGVVPSGVAGPQTASGSRGVVPVGRFDPLVPYASFGWLPAGFAASPSPARPWTLSGLSTTRALTIAAANRSSGHRVDLTVYTSGTCKLQGAQQYQEDPVRLD